MLVETLFAGAYLEKTGREAHRRTAEQAMPAWPERFLDEGKPASAREQLGHIFGRTTGSVAEPISCASLVMLQGVLSLLKTSRKWGRMCRRSSQCAMREVPKLYADQALSDTPDRPQIPAIVPTYNRLPI